MNKLFLKPRRLQIPIWLISCHNRGSRRARAAALCFAAAISACTTVAPPGPTTARTGELGEAMYKVEDGPAGFVISSRYAIKQPLADSRAAQAECMKQLVSTAHDLANSLQRQIQPISEQRIRVRMGRNESLGTTTCDASVPVTWKR